MTINDVAGETVYHVWDILCEFLGQNFVSGLRTLKSKKNLTTFSEKLVFFQPCLWLHSCSTQYSTEQFW